jgi:hypothetical protein
MLSKRISLLLVAVCLAAGGAVKVYGQDHELEGAALFERADIRPYDNWAEPRNGLFFSFDGLYWHISPPAKTTVGDPTLTPTVFYGPTLGDAVVQTNSMDTGSEKSIWKWGDRTELGYIEGHHGFMFTALSTPSQTADRTMANVSMNFNDPAFGPNGSHFLDTVLAAAAGGNLAIIGETPVTFSSVYMQNKSRLAGVEALYIYRMDELHLGGQFELLAGGRYFELKDQFWVDARGGNLTDSYWDTHTHNEIGGPEIGARWYQPFGRFAFTAETRFTAGINAQSITQDGLLAAGLTAPPNAAPEPTLMSAHSFTNSTHFIEFSPIIELRLEARAQLTNMIAVKAGWTGIFVNNVVRAADMVDYTLPNMGITRSLDGNMQNVFINGLTLGVEFNR